MNPPVVKTLEETLAQYNPVYAPQQGILEKQRAALPGTFDAQRAALEAKKTAGFNLINEQAGARGLAFSGIPLNEQAKYLSTEFLPGQQKLASEQNTQDLALQQQLAQLASEQRLKAIGTRETQQSALDKYLADRQAEKFQAEQTAADRAFKAEQAALDRALTRGGAGYGGGTPKPLTTNQLRTSAAEDVAYLFQGYDPKKQAGYTENVVIPQIQTAYPELKPQDIYNIVYPYRKSAFKE